MPIDRPAAGVGVGARSLSARNVQPLQPGRRGARGLVDGEVRPRPRRSALVIGGRHLDEVEDGHDVGSDADGREALAAGRHAVPEERGGETRVLAGGGEEETAQLDEVLQLEAAAHRAAQVLEGQPLAHVGQLLQDAQEDLGVLLLQVSHVHLGERSRRLIGRAPLKTNIYTMHTHSYEDTLIYNKVNISRQATDECTSKTPSLFL